MHYFFFFIILFVSLTDLYLMHFFRFFWDQIIFGWFYIVQKFQYTDLAYFSLSLSIK